MCASIADTRWVIDTGGEVKLERPDKLKVERQSTGVELSGGLKEPLRGLKEFEYRSEIYYSFRAVK
jgi:hypothetical protein